MSERVLCPCPECGGPSRVVDSRSAPRKQAVRRRRECLKCEVRFTTHERNRDEDVAALKRRLAEMAVQVQDLAAATKALADRLETEFKTL